MGDLTFPIFIDSTMLNDYRLCPRKWYYRYIEHLVPATTSVHLSAGGALAKALEVARRAFYESGHSQEDSVALGLKALFETYGEDGREDDKKSWDSTAGAFIYYTDQYPFADDHLQPYVQNGKATIEYSASIPLPIDHPETGEPLLYTGRFDMLARHTNLDREQAFCVDEKTTSRIDSKWAEKWSLRGQFIGYSWMSHEQGYDVAGAMVRGIVIHKNNYQLIEVPVYTPDWKIRDWYEGLLVTVKNMIQTWKENIYPKALNDACGMYSGCAYMRLCDSKNWQNWTEPYYERREWNPVKEEKDA